MKKPALLLGICVAMVVVGSAVCLPGICGCYSWAGVTDVGTSSILFLLLAAGGVIGSAISLIWLMVAAALRVFRTEREAG